MRVITDSFVGAVGGMCVPNAMPGVFLAFLEFLVL
jgi:hypothetical protein